MCEGLKVERLSFEVLKLCIVLKNEKCCEFAILSCTVIFK